MKKLLEILLFSIILLCSSCCCSKTDTKYLDPSEGVYMGLEQVALPGPEGMEDAFTIKMERFMLYGHDYILFYHAYDNVNGFLFEDDAWVHDPDCRKCAEKHSDTPLSSYSSMFDW